MEYFTHRSYKNWLPKVGEFVAVCHDGKMRRAVPGKVVKVEGHSPSRASIYVSVRVDTVDATNVIWEFRKYNSPKTYCVGWHPIVDGDICNYRLYSLYNYIWNEVYSTYIKAQPYEVKSYTKTIINWRRKFFNKLLDSELVKKCIASFTSEWQEQYLRSIYMVGMGCTCNSSIYATEKSKDVFTITCIKCGKLHMDNVTYTEVMSIQEKGTITPTN